MLDDVMARPEAPELSCVVDYETRSLRLAVQGIAIGLCVLERGMKGADPQPRSHASPWRLSVRRCRGESAPAQLWLQHNLPPRDTRALLSSSSSGGAGNAVAFVGDNPHPRLWRLLAEHALEARDWALAEKGFVHSRDLAVSPRPRQAKRCLHHDPRVSWWLKTPASRRSSCVLESL